MHSSNPTSFLLIRHAETLWNHEHRHAGRTEVPLADSAEKNILFLTKRLIHRPIGAIYSSPLSRCLATIGPTAEVLNLPVLQDERLLERDLGKWEGKSPAELKPEHPGYHFPDSGYTGDFRIPEAEPLEDLERRIRDFMHEVHQERPGQTVVISTHSGVIWTVQHRIVANPPDAHTWPGNCSITTVTTEGNHFHYEGIEPGLQPTVPRA